MPFGRLPFACPAQSESGPMMIEVLVPAFATYISPQDWVHEIHQEGSEVGRELDRDEALVSDRTT